MLDNNLTPTAPLVHSAPQFKGKVYGIELEIEANYLYCVEEEYDSETDETTQTEPDIPAGWLREQEDSIVGVELISDRPYPLHQSIENIERVFADIERQGITPIRTPRGSTHVHANVADLTWEQMRSFVMACAWAEPVLIELAGKGRKGNLFAQSYETTPIGWANVCDWVRKKEFTQNIDTHYMATSFYPMSSLGSVEFRMGPSSRNAADAIQWLWCIDRVVSVGRESEVGLEEPSFFSSWLLIFRQDKQNLLRRKAAKAAAEVWGLMNEPYVAPPVTVFNPLTRKYENYFETYNPQLGPSVPAPAPTPAPPYYGCGDPNCEICPPIPNNLILPQF